MWISSSSQSPNFLIAGFLFHLTIKNQVSAWYLKNHSVKNQTRGTGSSICFLRISFFRNGLTGRFGPLWNALRSVRYEADLTNILVGPNLSYYFKALQRMAGLIARPNSPNTVSAEYQATRGAYDLLLPTVASMLVASPYLGPALGTAFGVGAGIASSSGFKHFVLREIIEGLTGERYYVGGSGRKSSSGSSGSGAKY